MQYQIFKTFLFGLLIFLLGFLGFRSYQNAGSSKLDSIAVYAAPDSNFTHVWTAPSDWRMMYLKPEEKELVVYGRELIAHTSEYLGPKGSIKAISNGMNCQNCHLNAGTQPWGNNYFAVQSTYPKFRARSGTKENQIKRVNDCFERSLNGKALDSTSREMLAILAYIKWLGSDVEKDKFPKGSGIFKLKGMKRACDPLKGAEVYTAKCQSCHQADGGGVPNMNAPLDAASNVVGKDIARLVRIIRYGYNERVALDGFYYSNAMTASPDLKDNELADLLTYIRNSWSNKASAITIAQVQAAKKKK